MSGNGDNGNVDVQFKMKIAEWRGYVSRALEEISNNQKEMCSKIERLEGKFDARMDRTEEDVSDLKSTVSKMSGTISLIVSAIVSGIGILLRKMGL